jgi:hypothetical protein
MIPTSHFFLVRKQKNELTKKFVCRCCEETHLALFSVPPKKSQTDSYSQTVLSYKFLLHARSIYCTCCAFNNAMLHLLHAKSAILHLLHATSAILHLLHEKCDYPLQVSVTIQYLFFPSPPKWLATIKTRIDAWPLAASYWPLQTKSRGVQYIP